jgi:hypothetical protein
MYEHGDGGVVFALLKALDSGHEYFGHFDRNGDGIPDALDEAIWGAEFVAKMKLPETGGLRNTVSQGPGRAWTKWSTPETHTDNVVGTADDPVSSRAKAIRHWSSADGRAQRLLERRGRTNNFWPMPSASGIMRRATERTRAAPTLLSASIQAVTHQPHAD